MKVLKNTKVILIAVILIVGAVSTVLVVDGRKREDPSDVVWEAKEFDDFNLEGQVTYISNDILYYQVKGDYGSDMIAVDLDDDEVLWNHSYHEFRINSIYGSNEVIYSGSFARNIVAVDAESGEKRWNRSFPQRGYYQFISLHVSDDLLYTGFNIGTLVAMDADTGEKSWEHSYHNYSVTSVFGYEGVVYSGSFNDSIIATDAQTGEKLWSYSYGRVGVGDMYIHDGVLYSALWNGTVAAYDINTQEELWTHSYHSNSVGSVHADEDMVYSGGSDLTVIAASLENGEKVWSHEYHEELTDYKPHRIHSIHVVDEKVYSFDDFQGIAVEKEGNLWVGISRSLSAFGGALSSYIVVPILDHWLISLLILAGIGSSIALLVGEDEEKSEVRDLRRR